MMKRNNILFGLLMVISLVLLISGCGRSKTAVLIDENFIPQIIADNAKPGFLGAAGFFTVEEGQKIVVESTLNAKSEIKLRFSVGPALAADAAAEELVNAVNGGEAVLEITVKGPGTTEYEIAPGDYSVAAEALTKSKGKIVLHIK